MGKPPTTTSAQSTPHSLRLRVGNALYYTGLLGVPLGFGMMLGFYATDRGLP